VPGATGWLGSGTKQPRSPRYFLSLSFKPSLRPNPKCPFLWYSVSFLAEAADSCFQMLLAYFGIAPIWKSVLHNLRASSFIACFLFGATTDSVTVRLSLGTWKASVARKLLA